MRLNLKTFCVLVSKYGIVGISAASAHAIFLISLSKVIPLWISNLTGFLAASIVSYLGHALFTFRKKTLGKTYARRWLLIQLISNIIMSSILPILLSQWSNLPLITLLFILSPTILNAFIWNKATKFNLRRQGVPNSVPILHADDLGMSKANNNSIINLAKANLIKSASLLVNGYEAKSAIKEIDKYSLSMQLCLHLCLTEGPPIAERNLINCLTNKDGLLNVKFINLLLISFLPRSLNIRKRMKDQLKIEILSQIKKYKKLTNLNSIYIDGHQHIHLIPIVLKIILEISKEENIVWIRTTSEPLPTGIPLKIWMLTISQLGWIKWLILQSLSFYAKKKIKKTSLKTNSSFSGILFTGRMSEKILLSSWRELEIFPLLEKETRPIILSHPAENLIEQEEAKIFYEFYISNDFIRSPWRSKEAKAIINLNNSMNKV